MFDCCDHIVDRREVPVVGREAPGQLPHPFDRIKVRAIRRQVFKPEPGLRGLAPLLVQRRVMVARIVRDHDDSPVGTRTDFPEMPQEIEARLGIEASGLTPVNQLAVTQADGAEVTDAPPRRVMQQHWIHGLRRNPHPASRTVLLEVNFIHRPEVDFVASCQPPEFFLPGPDPQGWRWRSEASVSGGEIRVAGTIAGIAASPGSPPTGSSRTPTGSSRPTGFPSARNRSAACAAPRQCPGCAPRSTVVAGQAALPRSDRSIRHVRTGAPSRPPFAAHLRAARKLVGNSYPGRREGRRGGDDHIEIPHTAGSHPAAQEQRFLHLVSSVASCHQDITKPFCAQLIMTLCISSF